VYFLLVLITLFQIGYTNTVSAQSNNDRAIIFKKSADSLAETNAYKAAAGLYMQEFAARTMTPFRKSALVNAAYYYSMVQMRDSALYALDLAIGKYGFVGLEFLTTDSVMLLLAGEPLYQQLISRLKQSEAAKKNPLTATINTSDIDLFWKVYDRFIQDTSQAADRFLHEYFEKGTDALQEYYRMKTRNIGGIRGFANNIKKMPRFYAGIRKNTEQVASLKDSIRLIYQQLQAWYPDAIFPTLSFHIGGWSSGGTVSDYGLHVGADMYANNTDTDKSELDDWQKNNSVLFDNLKYVVAHELIHAQQNNMRSDTTLLKYVIVEGMADFIGELISGKTANEFQQNWAKGNEKRIWEAFKKEMYLDRYSNWIANSSQNRPDWPADLGYWVGYQICKAYFEEASNKKQAIYDMLHLSDYKGFWEKSRVEEKMGR
jgi:hypothetical protein